MERSSTTSAAGSRREATRQKLYEAAVTLIAEQGFSATTVDEIAERAGVAKGTVYYNFASKSVLFEELLRHGVGLLTASLRDAAEQTARFIRAVDHPYCKMMFDSFHANIEEKDQAAAIKSCAAETIHVHVSENDRGTPGTGQVRWDSFFRGLKETGYDGYLTIEAFGLALPALAAATRVWRPLFTDADGLCREGLAFTACLGQIGAEVLYDIRQAGGSPAAAAWLDIVAPPA